MNDEVLKISIQHSLNYVKAYNHQRLLALDTQFRLVIETISQPIETIKPTVDNEKVVDVKRRNKKPIDLEPNIIPPIIEEHIEPSSARPIIEIRVLPLWNFYIPIALVVLSVFLFLK